MEYTIDAAFAELDKLKKVVDDLTAATNDIRRKLGDPFEELLKKNAAGTQLKFHIALNSRTFMTAFQYHKTFAMKIQ